MIEDKFVVNTLSGSSYILDQKNKTFMRSNDTHHINVNEGVPVTYEAILQELEVGYPMILSLPLRTNDNLLITSIVTSITTN